MFEPMEEITPIPVIATFSMDFLAIDCPPDARSRGQG
jgi:hypothetical protein